MIDAGSEALDLLTYKEVAARLRLSEKTVRRLVAAGELECLHIGTAVRFAPEAVLDYKDTLRARAGKPAA